MCEFTMIDINFLFQNELIRVFPREVIQQFPFGLVPFRCSICGKPLLECQMKPPGRATRSLCEGCFEDYIANNISFSCFVCGNPLPHKKIENQYSEKREIRHYIEDGICFHRWVLIHCATLNEFDIRIAIETKLLGHDEDYLPVDENFHVTETAVQSQILRALRQNSIPKFKQITSYKGKPVKYLS